MSDATASVLALLGASRRRRALATTWAELRDLVRSAAAGFVEECRLASGEAA